MKRMAVVAMLLILAIPAYGFSASYNARPAINRTAHLSNETTCSSCHECTQKLDGRYKKVTLNWTLLNLRVPCIRFLAGNVIFDGGSNLIIAENGWYPGPGIDLGYYSGNAIRNIRVERFMYGIRSYAGNNTIIDNADVRFSSNEGVWIRGDGVTIQNSTFKYNSFSGILIFESNSSRIMDSSADGNGRLGINLINTRHARVVGNRMDTNMDYGLYLRNSRDALIYHNDFVSNNIYSHPGQAYDNLLASAWDNGYPSGGNYWSHINCTDIYSGPSQSLPGNDGICDMPATINSITDNYPYANATGWT